MAGIVALMVASCSALIPETSGTAMPSATGTHASVVNRPPSTETTAAPPAGLADPLAEIPEGGADAVKNGRDQLTRHEAEPALATFSDILATDPANVPALNGLGLALDMLGRHDEAQTAYRRVLALATDDRVARNNLGLSLTLSGRYADAIATLRPIALGGSASPRVRQNLAIAMALNGDRDGAARLARIDMREEDVQMNLNMLASMRR